MNRCKMVKRIKKLAKRAHEPNLQPEERRKRVALLKKLQRIYDLEVTKGE